jgi:hypothetical protein
MALRVSLAEASLKILDGGVEETPDDGEDHSVWAGTLPLRLIAGDPDTAPLTPPDILLPESVRRQQFGDALVVPGRRGEPADGEREGMDALVEEQVSAIGRVRLIVEPEHVGGTEAVGEVGHGRRQEARGTKPLAIDHEASEGTPVWERRRGDAVVVAPGIDGLVEDLGEVAHTVAVASRPIGGEHQPIRFDHPQPGPSRRRRQGIDRLGASQLLSGHRRPCRREQAGTVPGRRPRLLPH